MNREELKELIKEDIKIALYSLNEETGEQLSEGEIRDFLKVVIQEGFWDTVRAATRGALAGTGLDYLGNVVQDTVTGQGMGASLRGETERQQQMQRNRETARELNPRAYGLGEIGGVAGSLILPMGAAGLAARGAGAAVRGVGRALPGAAGRATRAVGQAAVDVGRGPLGTGALTRSTISRGLPGNTRAQRIARGAVGVIEPSPTSAALGTAAIGATALGGERARSRIQNTVDQAYGAMLNAPFAAASGAGRVAGYLGMSYEPEGKMLPESVSFSEQELAHIASIMEAPNSPGPNVEVGRSSALNAGLLRRGSSGDEVRQIQQLLVDRGYDLGPAGVDGQFGPATERAIRDFQTQRGLTVDGIVGRQTFAEFGDRDPITATHLDGVPANLNRTTPSREVDLGITTANGSSYGTITVPGDRIGAMTQAGRNADLANFLRGAIDDAGETNPDAYTNPNYIRPHRPRGPQ